MNTKAIITAIALGAVIGTASFVLRSSPPTPTGDASSFIEEPSIIYKNQGAMYWSRRAAQGEAELLQKRACRVLYPSNYMADAHGECQPMVDCTSCVTHKGIARNAVIHDNAWHPVKAKGPDYDAMMRADKLVMQMAMARRGEIEAGRQTYDHTVRCQRLWAGADVQCKS